jgi:Multicopper oxidase
VPKPDKLIAADINEPALTHRMPRTVIYTRPGDWLLIHVKNTETAPHSFHVHGLRYGIDSDGSWPFGTRSSDGRRSDEICPSQTWTYTYLATENTVGPGRSTTTAARSEMNRGLWRTCRSTCAFERPESRTDSDGSTLVHHNQNRMFWSRRQVEIYSIDRHPYSVIWFNLGFWQAAHRAPW